MRALTVILTAVLVAAILARYYFEWLNDTIIAILLAVTILSFLIHLFVKYKIRQ